jgi:hypothetical protein
MPPCPPVFLGVLCVNLLAVRLLALTCLGIIFAATVSAQSLQPEQTKAFIDSAGPPDENPQYFPVGVFQDDASNAEFRARWYAKHLRAMGEESLLSAAANKEFLGYRFLWLRTFHHPISMKLRIRLDGNAQLTCIELAGAGGYQPGKVLMTQIVELSKEQVSQFEALIRSSNFWELPTHNAEKGGSDGSQWILEGVKNQKYHVVDRWTPTDGKYREACLYLLNLSRLKVDPKHVY